MALSRGDFGLQRFCWDITIGNKQRPLVEDTDWMLQHEGVSLLELAL
jgi:hypothetical protein